MKFKNVVITFEEDVLELNEVEDMAVAMNGFLTFIESGRNHFYNFDDIKSYSWDTVEDDDDETTKPNLHVIQ